MGLTVYGGGGKPEEEKTVTAGTSVIEVLPSSGKTMKKVNVNPTPTEEKTITAGTSATTVTPTSGKYIKKVTVNPTPSQSKSVTPNESAQTVSPDSGKLLSSVSVGAIQTEEKTVTAGTSAIVVNPSSGKVMKKVTVNPTPTQEKTVTPTTAGLEVTPDSGYLLNKVIISGESDLVAENIRKDIDIFGVVGTLVEGVAGIDFGEVTISSNSAYYVKVAHNLGVVPSWAALIPKTLSKPSTNKVAENINGKVLYTSTANTVSVTGVSNELTSSEITFRANSSGNYVSQGYYWIAIA